MVSLVTITAVGDLMLGDHPVRIGNGVRSQIKRRGVDWLFSQVSHLLLTDSDIVFGNLEVVHSNIGLIENDLASIEFRGSPEVIPTLRKAGFNVLGIANNHCMEHGIEAFFDTVDRLRENNIFVAGMRGESGGTIPYTIHKDGVKIVFLAYSLRPETYYKCGDVPYSLSKESDILLQVNYARSTADIVIVSLHWGEEFVDHPSPKQINFAHNLVDAGAKLILGHHPHVLQGIEKYHDAVIAYSLGNFVFDMWQKKTRKTMILKVMVSVDGDVQYEVLPVYINSFCQPVPITGIHRHKALHNIDVLSSMISSEICKFKLEENSDESFRQAEKAYLLSAKQKVLQHRLGNYTFFILNIYRYKLILVWQSFLRFLSRRVEDFNAVFR